MSRKKTQLSVLGNRLKFLREREGFKQKKFAEHLGVQPPYISMIERGVKSPSNQLLLAICRTFRARIEWLRSGEGPMYETSYTYSSDDPLVQAIIRKLLSPQHRLSLGDHAMVFGIDGQAPDRDLPLPPEYWDAIAWVNRVFRDNEIHWMKAIQGLIRAWAPTDDELAAKLKLKRGGL